MTTPTPPQPNTGDERLKTAILKASTVRYATGSFTQKLYSNDTASPIEHKVQEIVEIGINDLMDLVKAELGAAEDRGYLQAVKDRDIPVAMIIRLKEMTDRAVTDAQQIEAELRNHFGIGEDV